MKTPERYLGRNWYLHPRALRYLYPSRSLRSLGHKCVSWLHKAPHPRLLRCTYGPNMLNKNPIVLPGNIPSGWRGIFSQWNIAGIPEKARPGCLWSRTLIDNMGVMISYKVTTWKLGLNSGHSKFKAVIIQLSLKVINSCSKLIVGRKYDLNLSVNEESSLWVNINLLLVNW